MGLGEGVYVGGEGGLLKRGLRWRGLKRGGLREGSYVGGD